MEAQATYSKKTVWIHWISALLIFGLIYTGINMETAPHDAHKFSLYKLHFSFGFTVFILTILRVWALLKDERPKALYPKKSVHQRFINFVHYGFYVVILWMCISGILSLFLEGIFRSLQSGLLQDLPEISKDGFHPIMLSHHLVAKLVFLLLIFHIGGFILHLIRKKENTLRKIWFK